MLWTKYNKNSPPKLTPYLFIITRTQCSKIKSNAWYVRNLRPKHETVLDLDAGRLQRFFIYFLKLYVNWAWWRNHLYCSKSIYVGRIRSLYKHLQSSNWNSCTDNEEMDGRNSFFSIFFYKTNGPQQLDHTRNSGSAWHVSLVAGFKNDRLGRTWCRL